MITTCPKCNTEFENKNQWGIKKFCSRKCANSRRWTEAQNLSRSKKLKEQGIKPNPDSYDNKKRLEYVRNTWKEKRLITSFNDYGFETKRKIIIEEQKNKCNRCSLDMWQGEKLILEIDHKDGNRKNNERENLEGLCPNCHSLTKTWRGRNLLINKNVTDEELIEALKTKPNIHQALWKVGLTARGKNYKRAKKLLENSVDDEHHVKNGYRGPKEPV